MKKIFTLFVMAVMAMGVNAETLLDFSQKKDFGITCSGSTAISTVKINENKTSVDCIKFSNSYMKDGSANENYAVLTVDGGFKAGDVVTIAGAFNNTDETKTAKIDLFTLDGTTPTVLFTTQQFINGRTSAEAPVAETYTLEADAEKLYIGRNGNTGTNVTTLKVVRGGEETSLVEAKEPTAATTWNFTQSLSDADAANLAADEAVWGYDEEKGYWTNKAQLAERNVLSPLKANGVELELTKGLTFTRDNAEGLGADRVRIAPGKYFAVNGSKVAVCLGELAKNDIIRLVIKGAGDSERSLTAVNAIITSGELTTADTDVHTADLKVEKDGTVTFETSNGFQFLALAINAELPEEMASINELKTAYSEATAYNLSGQKVAAGFKGIVVKNGKKVVVR